jgi:Putative DNA-binding domain
VKYVDWVESVLRTAVRAKAEAGGARLAGMPEIAAKLGLDYEIAREAIGDAVKDLERLGLLEFKSQWQIEIEHEARKIEVASLRSSWKPIHDIWLDEAQEAFLRGVVELSEHRADDRAWLAEVHAYAVFERLGWERDDDRIADLVFGLGKANLLVTSRITMGGGWNIYPTYVGVVRATETETSELHALVDDLLPDWETANVDFKRELHLDANDEKTEFVRDVLGLANTQVTGKRYLVIGWDPKSRAFTTDVDARVDQDRIEDILDRYTKPVVTVRYRTFPYASGKAAVLEVERDRAKVPYRVKQRLAGEKRVIDVGDVYVRHGSRVVKADADELADLEAEAARAREGRG